MGDPKPTATSFSLSEGLSEGHGKIERVLAKREDEKRLPTKSRLLEP